MITLKDKIAKIKPALKKELEVTNDLALPRLEKVVVSVGVGKMAKDKHRQEVITDRLAKITGQKPAPRVAKKSIASFKLREGEVIGYQVTIRGRRMYEFLDKLFNVAIPRIRDFRGFAEKSVDEMGNLTLGLREHTIFPEAADEDIKDVFGLAITLVTSAKDKPSALAFFRSLGFPFSR